MIADKLIEFEYVSVAIMALLIIIYYGKRKAAVDVYRVYFWLLIFMIFAPTINIITRMLIDSGAASPVAISIMMLGYTLLLITIGILLNLYSLMLMNINVKSSYIWNIYLLFPYIALVVSVIVNRFNKFLFYFNDEGNLIQDNVIWLIVAIVVYYCGSCIFIAIRYSSDSSKDKKVFLIGMAALMMLSVVVEILIAGEVALGFPFSLCMISSIIGIQNPQDIFDSSNAMQGYLLYQELSRDQKKTGNTVTFIIKLSGLSGIYDSFGDSITETVLRSMVAFLNSLNKNARVFRCSSEIFLLKCDVKDDQIDLIAESISERLKTEWHIDGLSFKLFATVLVARFPEDVDSVDGYRDLIRRVSVRTFKTDTIIKYSEMPENTKESEILKAVKKAVDNDGFKVYYQPIYSTKEKKITSAEALIRLIDDELGFISPEIFIPLAEKEGLILKIGRMVMKEVCRFFRDNELGKLGIEYIEINLSAVQCMQYLLAEDFCDIMDSYGIERSQINFEITETAAIKMNPAVDMNISYFTDHGVKLSLDDYGTGFSNISYVYSMPFSILKIDKGMLWAADQNEKANTVLRGTVRMAKKM